MQHVDSGVGRILSSLDRGEIWMCNHLSRNDFILNRSENNSKKNAKSKKYFRKQYDQSNTSRAIQPKQMPSALQLVLIKVTSSIASTKKSKIRSPNWRNTDLGILYL